MRTILLLFAATLVAAVAADNKKIVCYWGSWSVYRKEAGEFDLSYIDPKLCTHMIYTFIGLSPNGQVNILDPGCDLPGNGGKDNYNRFNKLREQNPSLKTMIAIGGWNEGSVNYSNVAANPNLRRTMVESIVAFVKKYNFDGFDVDWEYPAQRGGSPADKQNYVTLLKELRERFDQEGLILSAAVAAAEGSASQSYNIREISKYLHFINLMAYDLHGSWEPKTGMNAALYASSSESGWDAKLNVDAVIKYWLSQGAPSEKLVLGVPFYGRSFTLSNPQSNGVGAPASAGAAGPYTREAGMLGYNEICEKIKNDHWQVKYDEERKSVYAYKGNQWVSYDDEKTLKEKTDYIKKYNLGGAMVWSIETDDFRGKCGQKLPLLNALYRELGSGAASSPNVQSKPNGQAVKPQPEYPQQSQDEEAGSQDYEYSEEYFADEFDQSPVQPQQPQYPQQPEYPQQPPQQPEYPQQPPQQPEYPQQPPQQPQYPQTSGNVCQQEGYMRDPQDCTKFYYCQYFNDAFLEHKFSCPEGLLYDTSSLVCNWPNEVQC